MEDGSALEQREVDLCGCRVVAFCGRGVDEVGGSEKNRKSILRSLKKSGGLRINYQYQC